MFSLKLLRSPTRCFLRCGATVPPGLVAHCYNDPICNACLHQADPELAEALGREPAAILLLKTRLDVTCANCGDDLSGRRMAGHHLGNPLCTGCLDPHAPEMASLLLLDEAAREAADGGRDAAALLEVAKQYARRLFRLDAEHPRAPVFRRRIKPGGG